VGRLLVLLAFLAAALFVPGSAFAAHGQLTDCDTGGQNCTMGYSGEGSEANNAVVTLVDNGGNPQYQVFDPDAVITADIPCLDSTNGAPNDNTMVCPQNLVARLSIGLGDSNDAISVQADLPAELRGGAGSDTMTGGPQADTIYGDNPNGTGSGDDSLRGGNGNDTMNGGDGNDTFVAESGSDGADTLNGGTGVDTASFALRTAPQTLSIDGVANDGVGPTPSDNIEPDVENVVGGSGPDAITGSASANGLDGGAGDDSIAAGDGDDVANGGDGNDVEDGGAGVDDLQGGGGNDKLMGDAGGDSLKGGDGDDSVAGGNDADSLAGDGGNDSVSGGSGDDAMAGGDGADTMDGGDANDTVDGGGGDDTLDGGAGADTLAGGDGAADGATYKSRTAGVTVTLDDKPGDGEAGENDNVRGDVENVTGGAGGDTFVGSSAANTLDGGAGEDYEDGGTGAGADTLAGGDAGDVFRTRAGTGAATITCGPGPDFVIAKVADKVSGDCDRVDRGVNQKPKRRSSAVVAPAGGTLQMSPTGIVRRVPLQDKVVLPLRSVVDSVAGAVRVTTAPKTRTSESIKLDSGVFSIAQTAAKLAITELALQGGDFSACPKAVRGRATAHSAASKPIRRLWANGKGKFRTRGRYAAAVVRGTHWLTEDRCDGTLIRVRKGVVSVRDLVARKTVLVKAGRSYFASASRRR